MQENYIELLESFGIDDESIRKIEKNIITNNLVNFAYSQIDTISRMFKFCGCTSEQIGKIIVDNLSILQMSHIDIIKVAYVWDKTGALRNIDHTAYALRLAQLNRVYLRNKYLTSNITSKLNLSPSYDSLICGEEKFVKNFRQLINGEHFYPYYENLLNLFVKASSLEEQEEKLSQDISAKALNWHRLKFLNERNKENGSRKK